jgi:hypothetical protein
MSFVVTSAKLYPILYGKWHYRLLKSQHLLCVLLCGLFQQGHMITFRNFYQGSLRTIQGRLYSNTNRTRDLEARRQVTAVAFLGPSSSRTTKDSAARTSLSWPRSSGR